MDLDGGEMLCNVGRCDHRNDVVHGEHDRLCSHGSDVVEERLNTLHLLR